jgi:hypothetical protein
MFLLDKENEMKVTYSVSVVVVSGVCVFQILQLRMDRGAIKAEWFHNCATESEARAIIRFLHQE